MAEFVGNLSFPGPPIDDGSPKKKRGGKKVGPVVPTNDTSPLVGLKTTMLKTSLCRHWDRGHCKYGDQCGFAHGDTELSHKPHDSMTPTTSAVSPPLLAGSNPSSRQPSLITPPEPDPSLLAQFGGNNTLPVFPTTPAVLPNTLLPMNLMPQVGQVHGHQQSQQFHQLQHMQQQQLRQQQQKIHEQQQQLQHLQQQQHLAQQQLIQQQQMLAHQQANALVANVITTGSSGSPSRQQQSPQQQQQQQQQQAATAIAQQAAVQQPQQQLAASTSNQHLTTTSLNESLGWTQPSPNETPLVTSYVGLPLEHSLQGATLGGLAATLSVMPTKNSTSNNQLGDSVGNENPLSSNPDLLHLVLSQRRTKGFIVKTGNDPLVALPGVGTFSFTYKSVKKDHIHKLQVGSRVDFRLSQSHPPRAVSLRLLGDPQNTESSLEVSVDHSNGESKADTKTSSPNGDASKTSNINLSADAMKDGNEMVMSCTIGSDDTPDWPTTGTLLTNWNDTACTEVEVREKVAEPAAACIGAALCPLVVATSESDVGVVSNKSLTRKEPGAEMNAILAEILDLTDSPATGPLGTGTTIPQQPTTNITLPPDPFPSIDTNVGPAAWTVGLGGMGSGITDQSSFKNLAATLSVPPVSNLSHTFPPPGMNNNTTNSTSITSLGRRPRLSGKGSSQLELQVLRIQLESIFPKNTSPQFGDDWWDSLPADKIWPRLMTLKNIAAVTTIGSFIMGNIDDKSKIYAAIREYSDITDPPATEPFEEGAEQGDYNYTVNAIIEAVTQKKRLPSGSVGAVTVADFLSAFSAVSARERQRVLLSNSSVTDISLRETQESAARKLAFVLHGYDSGNF